MTRIGVLILTLAAAACGGDDDGGAEPDGGGTIDGGGGGADGGGCAPAPSDITCDGLDGTWMFENVSHTADTISLEGDLAISASGAMIVAFSDVLPDSTSDQDIFTTSPSECGWMSEPLTKDTDVQNTYPSLVVAGDTFHLVWSGYPEGLNDVYYATATGDGDWSERVNLTAEYESSMMRHAYAPSISIGPDGTIAVAYLSAPASDTGGFAGPAVVKVATVESGALAGPPRTVLDYGDDECFNPRAIHDGDGNLHVLAECGPLFNQDIAWATTAGPGPWKTDILPGTAGHDDMSITVALAGGTVHAAWVADLPCGDGTCRTLQHSALTGTTWSDPVSASQAGEPNDNGPALAIGPDDTIYLAFWRDNADSKSDVYLTRSTDGETFAPPCNLTRTETENEWMPSSLQVDATSGTLHLLYEEFVPASDPLDTEIIHGSLESGPG